MKQDTFISKLYAFISTYFIPRKYNNIIPEPKPIITTTNIPINNSSNIKSVSSLNSLNEYIRVLIVDDSIVFGKILKHQLECDGCQVDLLSNGEDAYYILKNRIFSYDILIIDIFMPYMYGTYLIKQIRTEIKNMVPIIVLSSIPEFGNEVLELGANLFFEKGYPLNALKHDIANLLFSDITDSFIDK